MSALPAQSADDAFQAEKGPELLSQCTPEILTPELVRRVATVCATFAHWSQEQVYRYLQSQGVAISQRQVRQAIESKMS